MRRFLAAAALSLTVLAASGCASAHDEYAFGGYAPSAYLSHRGGYGDFAFGYGWRGEEPRRHHHRHHGRRHDRDRDGVPNRFDRDMDGDGVLNWYDRFPRNPWRY